MQITIDVFALKIFAILMCKGTIREKATILFEAIEGGLQGSSGKDHEEHSGSHECSIAWSSGRMKLAFKKLIFFSEIFPKKYQN